jgi:hypothetical protein
MTRRLLEEATAASRGAGAQAPGSQASAAAPWPRTAGASPRAVRVRTAEVVEGLRALLADRHPSLGITDEAVEWLADRGTDTLLELEAKIRLKTAKTFQRQEGPSML